MFVQSNPHSSSQSNFTNQNFDFLPEEYHNQYDVTQHVTEFNTASAHNQNAMASFPNVN